MAVACQQLEVAGINWDEVAVIWRISEPLNVTGLRPAAMRFVCWDFTQQSSTRKTHGEDRFSAMQTPWMLWTIQTYVNVNSDARHQ